MPSGCDIINSALSGLIDHMIYINNKVAGYRRLAELIENATDPRTLIPDINALVPISSLDVQSYENLRLACPMLNLPSGIDGLEALKAALNSAYLGLINRLNLHPYGGLTRLVDTLDKLISQGGINYACVLSYLSCAAAMCGAAGHVSATLDANAAVIDQYGKNIANTTAAVLSDRAQAKVADLNAAITQLKNLSQ
jgi:hypothetical protein